MRTDWTLKFIRGMSKISLSVFCKKLHVIKIKLYDYGSESSGKKQNT